MLPDESLGLLVEVYSALQTQNCNRLVAMGLRALLDELMTQQVEDIGGFQEKVKEMVKQRHLSRKQESVLKAALELGNAATHRSHYPSESQLEAALDVVENLLQSFYALEDSEDKMTAEVKPRQKVNARNKPHPPTGRNGTPGGK
jgi:hypothetical protein